MRLILLFVIGIVCCDISRILIKELFAGKTAKHDIIVRMKEKFDLASLDTEGLDGDTLGRVVFQSLWDHAQRTQKDVIALLKKHGVSYTPFYINNVIAVQGASMSLIETLSKRADVKQVGSDRPFKVLDAIESSPFEEVDDNKKRGIEWNINFIKAPALWAKGFKGKGFVVASADTGVQFRHEAIVKNYRGNLGGGKFDHNYNWWDAIKSRIGSNRCGYNMQEPCDDNGHGSHTVGTMLGAGAGREFGVAPEAKWIGCRNMDGGLGRPSTYNGCLQFYLAPTDLKGANPRPELRPHSIGNSYGCPQSEECEEGDLKDSVEALRKAGIVVAVAAGNSGPGCSSISDPPGHYAASFSVAALNKNSHDLAYFSSRGPITVDGSNRRKPDISAPGVSVYSCYGQKSGNRYASLSGTSMATPHIAGATALLWSAKPELTWKSDETQKIFENSATPHESTSCSSPQPHPNNLYGYGTVNLEKAYQLANAKQ